MNVTEPAVQPERKEQTAETVHPGLPPPRSQPRRIPKGVPLRPAQAMLKEETSGAGAFGWLFGKP